MKKFYLLVFCLFLLFNGNSQPIISIAPGTNVVVQPGTFFSLDGLAIKPSSAFTMNNIIVSKNTTISHTSTNPFVSRVYQFSNNNNPFNGSIRYYYRDAELNGLSESTLTVNIHNGITWLPFTSATNDVVNNYVETIALSGQVINELTAAAQMGPLPLIWGSIYAYRESQTVKIKWEILLAENLQHFSVEKSTDGSNWTTIIDHIPARNAPGTQQYSATDIVYSPLQSFYRVKQTDFDGQFSYSKTVPVNAETDKQLLIYPNPVIHSFNIRNTGTGIMKQVRLFNVAGALVKTWTKQSSSYDIQDLPVGMYQLQISFEDGRNENIKINKQ